MQRASSTGLFLLFALIFVNFNPCKGSPVLGCDPEQPCRRDPYYEERKQELEDEIDDVNDYMQMVADQLTNDAVVVVRAVRTRITTPDIGDVMEPEILSLGAGDSGRHRSEDITSLDVISPTAEVGVELHHKDQNLLSNDIILSSEMKESGPEMKKASYMENLETKSLGAEIST